VKIKFSQLTKYLAASYFILGITGWSCAKKVEITSCEQFIRLECSGNQIVKTNVCDNYSSIVEIVEECGSDEFCSVETATPKCADCSSVSSKKCNEERDSVFEVDGCENESVIEICTAGTGCFVTGEGEAECQDCDGNDDLVCGSDGNVYQADSCWEIYGDIVMNCNNSQYCACLANDPNICNAACLSCENDVLVNCFDTNGNGAGDIYSFDDCGGELRPSYPVEECIYGSCQSDGDGGLECGDDCILTEEIKCDNEGNVATVELCQGSQGEIERTNVLEACDLPYEYCLEDSNGPSCQNVTTCHEGNLLVQDDADAPAMNLAAAQDYCARRLMSVPSILQLRRLVAGCSWIEEDGQCNAYENGCHDTTCFNEVANREYCQLEADFCNDYDGPGSSGFYWDNNWSMSKNHGEEFWSNTSLSDNEDLVFYINFGTAQIDYANKNTATKKIRCIKYEPGCD
jgi:hypothetical protein